MIKYSDSELKKMKNEDNFRSTSNLASLVFGVIGDPGAVSQGVPNF